MFGSELNVDDEIFFIENFNIIRLNIGAWV